MKVVEDFKGVLQHIDANIAVLTRLCALLARDLNLELSLRGYGARTVAKQAGLSRYTVWKALTGGHSDVLARARILDIIANTVLRTGDFAKVSPSALRYLRKTNGNLSPEAAASGMQIELSRLLKIESGQLKPSNDEIGKIKKFYAQIHQVAAEHGSRTLLS